jgi:hypothetical protein
VLLWLQRTEIPTVLFMEQWTLLIKFLIDSPETFTKSIS